MEIEQVACRSCGVKESFIAGTWRQGEFTCIPCRRQEPVVTLLEQILAELQRARA